MEEINATKLDDQKNNNICYLKALAEASKKTDLLSLNNIVFLAQFSFPTPYDDFKGFGKLGVSSSDLGWHYGFINEEKCELNSNINLDKIRNFGKLFSDLDAEKIGLVACWKFDRDFLNNGERTAAEKIYSTEIENKLKA